VANVQSYHRAKRLSEGMREAIHDRDAVNMAKGVLMARSNLDEEAAIGILLQRARQDGTTIGQAAQAVVESAVRRGR
jgi:AmiR/NasT family two-component response regulator